MRAAAVDAKKQSKDQGWLHEERTTVAVARAVGRKRAAMLTSACYVVRMSTRPLDTTDEAWAIVEEGLRRMSPAERVRRAISLTVMSHRFALANIRRLHPNEDERHHRLRLAARYIDADVMQRAFGYVDDGT